MEQWKIIKNYPDYECSTYGNIRSLNNYYMTTWKGQQITRRKKVNLIGRKLSTKGYKRINLDGKIRFVHSIIAETWILNYNNLPQVNHKDGNKLNNHIDNLEWVSNQSNRDHAVANKLHAVGERQGHSKLKSMHISKIKELYKQGLSQRKIGIIFNVCQQTIHAVISGKTWKNI